MNKPTLEFDDSIALFQYGGDIGYNSMLYDFNNIKVFEVFHDFMKSELTKKVFAIPELPFIRIQENKLGLIEYFSEISEFTTKLVDTDIQILIDISTGGISTSYYPDLLSLIKMHKLKYGNVTVLVNTKFEYETLVNLTKLENTPITVICVHRNEILFIEDLCFFKRAKRFLFLCRRWTPERLFCFLDLKKRGILDNTYYSFTFIRNPYGVESAFDAEIINDHFYQWIQTNHTNHLNSDYVNEIADFWQENKTELIYESPYWFGDNIGIQHDSIIAHKFYDSYISLCVETAFDTDEFHFQPSEKVYKCCYFRHPFLMYSTPRFLEYWNKSGYTSFSTEFDESYDKELNSISRIKMINDEVERLNNMQHSTFQEKMYRLQAQLNHNQNLLTEKFLETKNKNIYSSKNPMVDSILRNNYRTYQNSGFSQEENNILLNLTKDEQANS